MKSKKLLIQEYFALISLISLIALSCNTKNNITNPTANIQVAKEIIANTQSVAADSNVCYYKEFVEWNFENFRDVQKADSLAQWFAKSKYQIKEMWFPNAPSVCLMPFQTENIVTIRLGAPDTSLFLEGYKKTSIVTTVCFQSYRHYIFIKSFDGY